MASQTYDLRGMTLLASKVKADELTLETLSSVESLTATTATVDELTVSTSVTFPEGSFTLADLIETESRIATADGTGTGAISAFNSIKKFVTVTSAAATNQIALPTASAGLIGREIDIYVGANGYELITLATSGDTINTVDSDGTNQLDVAANSLLRLVQVTATGWYAFQVTATTITVVAPDND
jgi:hypothetical protein